MREFCTKWWKRIATVDMLFIGVLTLLASLFASWLKQFPGFSLFGALIIALLIGMIIQFPIRSAYVGSNDGRKAGVKDAAGLISNKLLRLGIILLGFKLNLAVLFTQGIKCLPIAAVVVTLTIIVCYAIARKLGKLANALDHMVVDQEVLAQAMLGRKAKLLQQLPCCRGVCQRRSCHGCLLNMVAAS